MDAPITGLIVGDMLCLEMLWCILSCETNNSGPLWGRRRYKARHQLIYTPALTFGKWEMDKELRYQGELVVEPVLLHVRPLPKGDGCAYSFFFCYHYQIIVKQSRMKSRIQWYHRVGTHRFEFRFRHTFHFHAVMDYWDNSTVLKQC